MDLDAAIDGLALTDHHVHQALAGDLARAEFEQLITEAGIPAPAGTTQFDSQAGFAIRRWCAPVLDLEPFPAPADYLDRRTEPGGCCAALASRAISSTPAISRQALSPLLTWLSPQAAASTRSCGWKWSPRSSPHPAA